MKVRDTLLPSRFPARQLASAVTAYLLSLTLFLLITAVVLLTTFFSPEYHIRKLSSTGFARTAAEELRVEFQSFAAASGVDKSVLTDGITMETVLGASEASMRVLFHVGAGYDYEGYREKMYNALEEYVHSNGFAADEDGLKELAELCAETLEAHTESFFYTVAVPYLLRLTKPLQLAVTGLALLALVLTAALVWPERNRISRAFHSLSCALAADVICFGIIWIWIHASGVLNRLGITPPSYNRLFSGVFRGAVDGILWSIVLLIPVLALCLILYFHFHNRKT